MKLPNGMVINLEARNGRVRMRMPFGQSLAVVQPASVGPLNEELLKKLNAKLAGGQSSLSSEDLLDTGLTFDQINPIDSDFIYPSFRALSKTLIPDYFLDFSQDNVVKEAVALFAGQTVYSNHVYWRVENWLGAISKAEWDETGEKVGGVPGVNVELKIDWKSNPKIARGLLMKPPAIHSVSATILFDWDASHPDLLEQGIFWRNLGQEIEGSIVRIVVTKITAVFELSLVFQGANPESNGHLPDDEEYEEMSAPQLSAPKKPTVTPLKPKETKKVKLTPEQKTSLAITAEGEEVDDAIVIDTAIKLAARASAADPIVSAERAEVLRLATLVEGSGEGDARKLSPELTSLINGADVSQLPGLRKLYQDKFDAAFPLACEHGHKATARRSSVEQPETVKDAPASASVQGYPGL